MQAFQCQCQLPPPATACQPAAGADALTIAPQLRDSPSLRWQRRQRDGLVVVVVHAREHFLAAAKAQRCWRAGARSSRRLDQNPALSHDVRDRNARLDVLRHEDLGAAAGAEEHRLLHVWLGFVCEVPQVAATWCSRT